jgi:ATP phosphoribosyltransferase
LKIAFLQPGGIYMLKIALPNKGALHDDAVLLVKEAGYSCKPTGRELVIQDEKNEVEFFFLRPRDIAVYVGTGLLDLGITGRDLVMDSEIRTEELLPLQFGTSKFCYAVPQGSNLSIKNFNGIRIATSYPFLLARDLENRKISANIVKLDGAVEISIRLGVADAIADVVESGRTIEQAGLRIIGDPVMISEAVLIKRRDTTDVPKEVKRFIGRLKGIIVAREYVMIEYDVEKKKLAQACGITPGIESPTIAPLAEENWAAVKAMAKRMEVNKIMDDLEVLGARGILVTDIRTCRL